jgi:hypothetical protein
MYEKLLMKKVAIVTVIIVLSIAVTPTLLMSSNNAKAATTTTTSSRSEQVITSINDPNNILSGSGQGQIQCPANPAATSAYRSLQISFGAVRKGTITGNFDVSNNLNGRSVIAGSIDNGQIIQNHFTITGITKETFGFACGSGSSSTASTTTISNNGVPIPNTLVIPTRITISGQCEIGATTTTTMQFTAANGQTGTFAGPVSCG